MYKDPEVRRARRRELYWQKRAGQVRKRPGPVPGTIYRTVCKEPEDRASIETFRLEQQAMIAQMADLPHTCEFCDHYAYEGDLARQFCDISQETIFGSATCRWKPRFRVDDDE